MKASGALAIGAVGLSSQAQAAPADASAFFAEAALRYDFDTPDDEWTYPSMSTDDPKVHQLHNSSEVRLERPRAEQAEKALRNNSAVVSFEGYQPLPSSSAPTSVQMVPTGTLPTDLRTTAVQQLADSITTPRVDLSKENQNVAVSGSRSTQVGVGKEKTIDYESVTLALEGIKETDEVRSTTGPGGETIPKGQRAPAIERTVTNVEATPKLLVRNHGKIDVSFSNRSQK